MATSNYAIPSTSAHTIQQSSPSTSTSIQSETDSNDPPLDTFIADLLKSVAINEEAQICTSCEDGVPAASRCSDCSELLCDPCVHAHLRVRLTKDHRIVRFNGSAIMTNPNGVIAPPITTNRSLSSSSRTTNSPCSSGSGSYYCEIHHEQIRFLCEQCIFPSCSECTLQEHRGHKLTFITDAIDHAAHNNMKLLTETRSAISAVRDAIMNVQRMNDSVELRSHQAVTDVHKVVRRYVNAVEEREKDLFVRIEHQRQLKNKNLVAQKEGLTMALSKLLRTNEILNESVESGNGLDMIFANDRAEVELKQLRTLRGNLQPCEDDMIVFIPPDPNLLRAVSTLGNINTILQFARPRNDIPSYYAMNQIDMNAECPSHDRSVVPTGRPIFNAPMPVLVRNNGPLPSLVFGFEGEEEGFLCRPWGICCDKFGNILIADRSNNRIQVFNPNGTYRYMFGSQGTAPGQFDRPAGLTVDPMDRIVVADKDNHRVQVFTMEGDFVLCFGEKGCRVGQFNYPWDVATNSIGQIVVSDTRNHRVQLFNSDGKFVAKYGFDGMNSLWKNFDSPRGVCFDHLGNVIATDFNNHRLVVIEPNFEHARFLGGEGTGLKQFMRPQGVIVDDEGRIIVADSRNNRIQVFEANGAFLWTIGRTGTEEGEMDRPSGLCISPDGKIMVIDFGNNRVQIF